MTDTQINNAFFALLAAGATATGVAALSEIAVGPALASNSGVFAAMGQMLMFWA